MTKKLIIPEKILIVWPNINKSKIKVLGDDEDILALPAFAVDATREKLVTMAKNWARRYSNDMNEKEVDNKPFSIRIYNYEYRTSAMVFKVVTDDGFTYDLRDNESLEVILKEGIAPGGKANSKFIWAINGGQHMRMIREGKVNENLVKDILI